MFISWYWNWHTTERLGYCGSLGRNRGVTCFHTTTRGLGIPPHSGWSEHTLQDRHFLNLSSGVPGALRAKYPQVRWGLDPGHTWAVHSMGRSAWCEQRRCCWQQPQLP